MVYVCLTKNEMNKFNEFEDIAFVIKKPHGDWCMKKDMTELNLHAMKHKFFFLEK